ncbi:class I SAM-dependent methyltransferase [Algivirga pacifica]|uniref:Class I SAM-dependent methyltransferase n=1 Tax=Algivirga pacifica TaxID=1162670 RepID=A0ABP9D5W6_9BACT
MGKKKEWFDEWFNTTYYHLLYRNRDDSEAQFFMDNLIRFLEVTDQQLIMDLACGKGRHSIYLNNKGLKVEGLDLSEANITYARQFANERLTFTQHDMRLTYKEEAFDYVFNMFTSFGYFETTIEDIKAIQCTAQNLKKGGILVMDYFNTYKVINSLPKKEDIQRDHITFMIHKFLKDQFVFKEIAFNDDGRDYIFTERVKAMTEKDFQHCFEKANLKVIHTFGDYALNPFDKNNSDRMIFIVQKES